MSPIGINLLIALIWVFLSSGKPLFSFLLGFSVGFFLLALFPHVLKSKSYVRRTKAFVRFLGGFLFAFLHSNITLARAILFRPKESIRPNFIRYDVSDLGRMEIFLLTHCISLTPGTTTVAIDKEFKTVLIHAFDGEDAATVRVDIDKQLKQPILGFTR